MKPHEEQWKHRGQEEVVRTSEDYIRAAVYGAGHKAAPHYEVARFIAAAPDMARALLEIRDAINTGTLSKDAQEVAERALRKAGVLP